MNRWIFSVLFFASALAHADIVISTADQNQCRLVREAFALPAEQAPCVAPEKADSVKGNSKYQYLVRAHAGDNATFYLTVENLRRKDDVDWERAGWRFDANEGEREFWVKKRIADFKAAVALQVPFRDAMFMIGTAASEEVIFDAEKNQCRDRKTGQVISCSEAQVRFIEESPRNKNYMKAMNELGVNLGLGTRTYNYIRDHGRLRSSLEVSAVLLTGMGLYWALIEYNRQDHDFDWTPEGLRKKWVDLNGVRFDNNNFYINTGHAMAGAWYYMFPRINNANILESFLVSTAASFLWEALVEYAEVVSINDMITTPAAGVAIGEVLFQLGEFFNSGKDNLVNRVLGSIFGHSRAVDSWIFKNKPKRSLNVDAHGFSRDAFHNFKVFAGVGATTTGGKDGAVSPEAEIGLNTEIITIPEYERPETVSHRILVDGNFTQLIVKSSFGEKGLNDFLFYTKAALAGYYTQKLKLDEKQRLEGYSFFIGASTAFDMSLHKNDRFTDQLAIVNILGPTMDIVLYYKGARVRATVDVYANFATLRSFAYDEWAGQNQGLVDPATGQITGIKTILSREQNYHAWGATGQARLVANYGGLEAGGEIRFDGFDSFEGRDRLQSTVTDDFNVTDSRRRITLWGALRLPRSNWKVGVAFEDHFRTGKIKDVTVKRSDKRLTGYAIYEF